MVTLGNSQSLLGIVCYKFDMSLMLKQLAMENKNVIINESRNTPEVILDTKKRYFSLRGVSYPENAQKFYEPVFDMAKKYIDKIKEPKNDITMEVDFDYFNTSSARMLYQIFRLFNNAAQAKEMGVNIVWKYESDDVDMIESGKDFDVMFNELKFCLQEKDI